jgi:LPPG:FO 2-phospho-L-lactate transferase
MIVALAGGVGGAKLAAGLYRALPPDHLAVVVNTADDFELFGLRIAPDLDTVMYTLAGLANAETGWGVAGDTFAALDMLRRYGQDCWFWLGDRDLATHLLRTQRLRASERLTVVTAALASALGVTARLLPMTDDPVATVVRTPAGELAFQEYFVRRQQRDEVLGVRFAGGDTARMTDDVRAAVAAAEAIILCPSNPIVSIGPILAVPGMRALLMESPAPKVAISPIVGGHALKGPADRMLAGLGHEVSPLGVARVYHGLIDGLVIDHADAPLAADIESLGLRVLVAETVMRSEADRERLAREAVEFAHALAGRGSAPGQSPQRGATH